MPALKAAPSLQICLPIRSRRRPGRPGGGRTQLLRGPNLADGDRPPHCFAHTLLVSAAVLVLRPLWHAGERAVGSRIPGGHTPGATMVPPGESLWPQATMEEPILREQIDGATGL